MGQKILMDGFSRQKSKGGWGLNLGQKAWKNYKNVGIYLSLICNGFLINSGLMESRVRNSKNSQHPSYPVPQLNILKGIVDIT